MKKLLVFLGLFFCFVTADYAQQHIARHYWLNDSSYNHTLALTSDGGYILAAARQELGANKRNTIAVFKLDNAYNIVDSRIIGLPGGEGFDNIVNFEVQDIVEEKSVEGNNLRYVICGSINHIGGGDNPSVSNLGMVLILKPDLSVLDFREYPAVEMFYSVYAADNYYYVCGKTHNREGIILRDDMSAMNPVAYVTTQNWEYHKVIANNNGNDIVASGTDRNDIGFSAFDIGNFANLAGLLGSWMIVSPYYSTIDAKAVVTNHPNYSQGLILSATGDGYCKIYTYFYFTYNQYHPISFITTLFNPQYQVFLEDMEVDINSNPIRIAWIGNHTIPQSSNLTAFYITENIPPPMPVNPPIPFPISTPTYVYYPFSSSSACFRLHKVHFNSNDNEFHCGGFYNHHNNNKTTFVVAPEQAILTNCGTMLQIVGEPESRFSNSRLSIIQMTVIVKPNTWHEIQYEFCDTDCEDKVLDNNINNINCGNQ